MLKTGPYLIATLLVKNEEDILEHSLKHHIEEQNIQFIIATDNNSTDNTKKILKSFKEVKIIIDENGSDHDQSKWVTRMAKLATIYDPKWIVHLDADEFWCNLQNLYNYDKQTKLIKVDKFYNHLVLDKNFSFESTKYYHDQDNIESVGIARTPPKIIHKPINSAVVENGNHNLHCDFPLNQVHTDKIWVHHFPVRSYKQFERKVRDGATSLLKLGQKGTGQHWMDWFEIYKKGMLEIEYEKFIANSTYHILTRSINSWMPMHELLAD